MGAAQTTRSPSAPSPISGRGATPARFPFSRVVGEGARGWGLPEGEGAGDGGCPKGKEQGIARNIRSLTLAAHLAAELGDGNQTLPSPGLQ